MLFFTVIALVLGYIIPYFIIAIPILLIANPLIRSRFHYILDDKYIRIHQGVISKKERNLPYGVIQHVFLKQDIFDRIFGLATLRLENAGQGAEPVKSFRLTGVTKNSDSLGASGNKINIPGLKKKDAEALKVLVLQKMKENPLEDGQSGL